MGDIVFELPHDEYHASKALGSTQIRWFMKSPLYFKDKMSYPPQSSEAMDFGSAVHLAILQPEDFANTVVAKPECDRRTTKGKEIWAKFQEGLKPGTLILDPDEIAAAARIANTVWHTDWWKEYQKTNPRSEVSCFATLNGIACKARLDSCPMEGPIIVDIKTTVSAKRHTFEKSIWKYGYAIQAAFHMYVARECGLMKSEFILMAIEKSSPYDFQFFRLKPALIAKAMDEITDALERLAVCAAFDEWPGYPKIPHEVDLPAWASGDSSTLFTEDFE
jgi:hypothetical protein